MREHLLGELANDRLRAVHIAARRGRQRVHRVLVVVGRVVAVEIVVEWFHQGRSHGDLGELC